MDFKESGTQEKKLTKSNSYLVSDKTLHSIYNSSKTCEPSQMGDIFSEQSTQIDLSSKSSPSLISKKVLQLNAKNLRPITNHQSLIKNQELLQLDVPQNLRPIPNPPPSSTTKNFSFVHLRIYLQFVYDLIQFTCW